MPKTKVQDGKTYELINSRWHLKDATEDDIEVRNGKNGKKEYRVKGTDKWQGIDDTTQGEIASQMDVNAKQDIISGIDEPKRTEQRPKKSPKNWGQDMLRKPWNYDSPLAYLKAVAISEPKSTIGRLLFNTINTASWLNAWYSNRKGEEEIPQTKAVSEGHELALRNLDGWMGGLKDGRLDEISSKDLTRIYQSLDGEMKEMEPLYRDALGRTDPDSLRIKTQYKTYQKMKQNLDRVLSNAKARERPKEWPKQGSKEDAPKNPNDMTPEEKRRFLAERAKRLKEKVGEGKDKAKVEEPLEETEEESDIVEESEEEPKDKSKD